MYFQRVQFTVKLNTIMYELNKNQNTKMNEELLLKTRGNCKLNPE